ncbi:MAG: metal ABC transporter substrate-binding protein [Gaiellaceae bacterium]
MTAVRALAILIAVVSLTGCDAGEQAVSESRSVVTGLYPLAWAAERVASDSVDEVVNLTQPGAEPHDLELSPRDAEAIRDAYVVLYAGSGFQPAIEDAVASRQGLSVDVSDGARDPHVWLDPLRFAQIVDRIATTLGDTGSAPGEIRVLERLDAEYRRGLEACERRTLVTMHAAFGHLAARYRLTELSLAGRSPEAEPSPQELERLVEKVRASGATTIFAEPLVSDRLAETVARETGVEVAVLDPVEGLSQKRLDAGEDYLSVMRANLAALRKALGCR